MAHLTAIPSQTRVRILAADSNAMSTQLLVGALGGNEQFQVIDAPSSAPLVLSLLKRERPQIAVISANLGEGDGAGFDLVREIRAHCHGTRVVMLLDTSERVSVTRAFRAGAQGVFCRTEPFRLLEKCIQCVNAGQVWANSAELQFVLESLAHPTSAHFDNNVAALLSAREIDVVRCVTEGMTNREIAERLNLTQHTVKNYLFRIFDKLGVSSRVEVVLYALGNGNRTEPAAPSKVPAPKIGVRPSRALAHPVGTRNLGLGAITIVGRTGTSNGHSKLTEQR